MSNVVPFNSRVGFLRTAGEKQSPFVLVNAKTGVLETVYAVLEDRLQFCRPEVDGAIKRLEVSYANALDEYLFLDGSCVGYVKHRFIDQSFVPVEFQTPIESLLGTANVGKVLPVADVDVGCFEDSEKVKCCSQGNPATGLPDDPDSVYRNVDGIDSLCRKLAVHLGLGSQASGDDVVAAVGRLVDECTSLQARLSDMWADLSVLHSRG